MTHYKEFQGKTLDDAIKDACDYYGVAREKLEIEIINGAKSGIFGLVGAKKATIRASRVQLSTLLDDERENGGSPVIQRDSSRGKGRSSAPVAGLQPRETVSAGQKQGKERPSREGSEKKTHPEYKEGTAKKSALDAEGGFSAGNVAGVMPQADKAGELRERDGGQNAGTALSREKSKSGKGEGARGNGRATPRGVASARRPEARNNEGELIHEQSSATKQRGGARSGDQQKPVAGETTFLRESLPEFSLEACDTEELFRQTQEVISSLITPMVGDAPCSVEIVGKRLRVILDCGDAAALLVGRDGQTLAAVQHLAAKILARKLGGIVRLQIDTGQYREHQDSRLKELALSLAARVKETGRSMSTRPLSAYQRRIIHLAMQGDDKVITRSKGEGFQRRVIIYPAGAEKLDSGVVEREEGEASMESFSTGTNRDAQDAEHKDSIAEEKPEKQSPATAEDADALTVRVTESFSKEPL